MDFDLSEEQRLLKESVDGLLKSSYDFEARKKYGAEKGGWSKSVWSKLAEQGLLGLRKGLGLYANLRPVKPLPALYDASPLRRERGSAGVGRSEFH